jgi:hypothetical protein
MTIAEFNRTRFYCGMFAIYEDEKYIITAVDFGESLIEIQGYTSMTETKHWVRCENVEISQLDNPE